MPSSASAQFSPLSSLALWTTRLLTLVAAALAGYLGWTSLAHARVLGCGPGTTFDCDTVLSSPWSSWLGIPVALLGCASYLGIFVASWLLPREHAGVRRLGIAVSVMLATLVAGAALWFIAVQMFLIHAFCPLCLVTHLCGLVSAAILLVAMTRACTSHDGLSRQQMGHLQAALSSSRPAHTVGTDTIGIGLSFLIVPYFLAMVALAVLIGVQVFMPAKAFEINRVGKLDEVIDLTTGAASGSDEPLEPTPAQPDEFDRQVVQASAEEPIDAALDTVDAGDDLPGVAATATFEADATPNPGGRSAEPRAPKEGSRQIELEGGQVKIDVYQQAILGSPDAPYIVIEMFDYTCKHCRRMHALIEKARKRYGDDLAIVLLPVPLELSCNKIMEQAAPRHRGACKFAHLALAMARIDLAAFEEYHDWLMADEEYARALDSGIVMARSMVDSRKLISEEQRPELKARIQNHIKLFAALRSKWKGEKKLGLPLQIAGDQILSPNPETVDQLCEFWESALGIQPVASSP